MPKSRQKKVALTKEPIFRSDCISTIYPKSRFCTKRHKRRCFQGFSGFFESFSRNAEKENCKFEHRKCKFVFDLCFSRTNPHPWRTPFLCLQRGGCWGMKAMYNTTSLSVRFPDHTLDNKQVISEKMLLLLEC